jgi:hypothetical protein
MFVPLLTDNFMKKITISPLLFVVAFVSLVISACSTNVSITKRYHNRGFQIAWGNHQPSVNATVSKRIAIGTQKTFPSPVVTTDRKKEVWGLHKEMPSPTSYALEILPRKDFPSGNNLQKPTRVNTPEYKMHVKGIKPSKKNIELNKAKPHYKNKQALYIAPDSTAWGILSFSCGLLAWGLLLYWSFLPFYSAVTFYLITSILLAAASIFLGIKGQHNRLKGFALTGLFLGSALLFILFLIGLLTALFGTGAG